MVSYLNVVWLEPIVRINVFFLTLGRKTKVPIGAATYFKPRGVTSVSNTTVGGLTGGLVSHGQRLLILFGGADIRHFLVIYSMLVLLLLVDQRFGRQAKRIMVFAIGRKRTLPTQTSTTGKEKNKNLNAAGPGTFLPYVRSDYQCYKDRRLPSWML
jgi:hypothetical protein